MLAVELVAVVFLVGLTVRAVFRKEFTPWMVVLFGYRLLELVAFFAAAYRVVGITGPGRRAETIGPCLYFSIITITTIGYGDWYPLPQARVFVAFEALIGWLYMGLFIAALTNYLGRRKA
ncbi:potassium channel family protein [Paraburkholderia sediminicola]|uniref:potassium channel family protein n=1 Tax=Paraburkholderia sediminicola TaxID=458836 RepID=UPI0038B7BBE9